MCLLLLLLGPIPSDCLIIVYMAPSAGPCAVTLVGVMLILLAGGAHGASAAGGLITVAGTLLVGFGLFGIMTAYITFWLSRAMLHAMLHALVEQQVRVFRV